MTEPGVDVFSYPPFGCPDCGGRTFEVVIDDDEVNFFCSGCGSCWHDELDYVSRVDPRRCRACGRRDACLQRLAVVGT